MVKISCFKCKIILSKNKLKYISKSTYICKKCIDYDELGIYNGYCNSTIRQY